jgi:glycosidase
MPGKPFMYYGEEIGMRGSGRDENKRLPIIWSEADKTGETNPASAADYNMTLQVTKGVDDLMAIPDSLWNHYKKVISVRNKYNDFIETARLTATNIDPRLYTLTYATDAGELTIITNITATTIAVGNSEGWTLLEGIYPTLEKGSVTASDLTIPPFTTFILE